MKTWHKIMLSFQNHQNRKYKENAKNLNDGNIHQHQSIERTFCGLLYTQERTCIPVKKLR